MEKLAVAIFVFPPKEQVTLAVPPVPLTVTSVIAAC
jgi:hypothetical protein